MTRCIPGLVNEIDLIKPIGISGKRWNQIQKDYFENEIPQRKKAVKRQYRRIKRVRQNERLENRIDNMLNPTFVTVTLNDDYVIKDISLIIRNLRLWFGRNNVEKWVLVSDYGSNTERLHFHGFVDMPTDKFIKLVGAKYIKHNTRYSIYRADDFLTGSISINKDYENNKEKAIRYCTKYITKDLSVELPKDHKIYGSKVGRLEMSDIVGDLFDTELITWA